MGLNPKYKKATEAIEQAQRELRSARTITSDFTLRDAAIAAAEEKLEKAVKARNSIPMRGVKK